MGRPRNLICIVALAAHLLCLASLASAASTRGVHPKAKGVAPHVARSGNSISPRAKVQTHSGRSAHASSGYHRSGGYGVSRYPNRNGSSGPMVASLRSVVARLHQADHDYNGHRVQAIHQLNQAIGAMTPGKGTGGASHVRTASQGRGTGPTLTQAQSDAHLRQAHQQLLALERQMGGQGTTASRHPQAHNHVRAAIGHLNTALAVR